ncbi:hypothetical protein PMAYCL1PPCAC_09144, partial [Pristionchus mayeri]
LSHLDIRPNMHTIDIVFLLFCVYIPILIAVSILEIWIIVRPKSKFRSSFYFLFVASAVVDLLNIADGFPEFRLAVYPLTNGGGMTPDFFAKIRNLSFVFPMTQDFLNAFIAFGCVMAISMPKSQRMESLLPFFLAFSYVFSLVYFIPVLFRNMGYIQVPRDDYFIYLGDTDTFDWFPTHICFVTVSLLLNFISVVFYTRASFLLRRVQVNKQVLFKHLFSVCTLSR